jgi:formylglycine-generating enzyme required for sulfatase activity
VILTYTLPEIVVDVEDRCGNPAFPGRGRDSRAVCLDALGGNKSGPRLVVVPAGGPVASPFAITKYEITVSEYNTYCDLSGSCSRRTGVDPALPLTNISLLEAQAYAQWLSTTTGFEYRLPNSAEWQYAAEAPGTEVPPRNYNCLLREGGRVTKGQQLQDVRTGEPNGWGLQNYVGNAREWVVEPQGIWALGGSHQDAFSSCDIKLRVTHDGQPDAVTGFRLVRKVNDSS